MGYKGLWVIRGMGYEGFDCTPCFRMHSPYLRSKMVRSGVSRKVEQQAPYIREIMEAGSQAPA